MKVFKWLWSISIGMLPVFLYATAMSYIATGGQWQTELHLPIFSAPIWGWEILRIAAYALSIFILAKLVYSGCRSWELIPVLARGACHLIASALFFLARRSDWAGGALGVIAIGSFATAVILMRRDKLCGCLYLLIALWDCYMTAVCIGIALG